MPVPKFFDFFSIVMECLLSGEVANANTLKDFAAKVMHISDEDQAILLPSGKQSMLYNRLNWATTYLRKAGLISSPRRGQYQITAKGREAYKQTNGKIDLKFLNSIESFIEFQTAANSSSAASVQPDALEQESTPQDVLDKAYQQIKSSLMDDLLAEIMNKSPVFF